MSDEELVRKKLAFTETCLRELRTLARPERIAADVVHQRFVAYTVENHLGDLDAFVAAIRGAAELRAVPAVSSHRRPTPAAGPEPGEGRLGPPAAA